LDRRGVEWAFYESASRQIPPNVPLALLYDDWDRNAYDGALGALPHDLAVRLFYLGRPACWHASTVSLTAHVQAQTVVDHAPNRWRDADQHVVQPTPSCSGQSEGHPVPEFAPTLAVIGRDRDLAGLAQLGRVEIMARGPALRRDRTYTLFRIILQQPTVDLSIPIARFGTAGQALHR
jgi:hypothetical protein